MGCQVTNATPVIGAVPNTCAVPQCSGEVVCEHLWAVIDLAASPLGTDLPMYPADCVKDIESNTPPKRQAHWSACNVG